MGELSDNDVEKCLQCALSDEYRSSGTWAYYLNRFGDGESGEVVYQCGDDTMQAPYSVEGGNGSAPVCTIDFDNAVEVFPIVQYLPVADDADHFASMESAKLYKGGIPLYERFVSKGERANMDSSDFAGKGKSFPINKPGDVMAAFHSLGRAGSDNHSVATIRANIIKIAKRKGYPLPKSVQEAAAAKKSCPDCVGGKRGAKDCPKCKGTGKLPPPDTDADEAARPAAGGSLKLIESTPWAEELVLIESEGREVEIKLIAPGKGSSAFYPSEVLQRDGPGVFKKNTQIFINHATKAEEAARPEGDWHKLAGALSTDAYWKESAKHGPGLFAMAKFAADIAPAVIDKAPYSGMSIRANGDAVMESGRPKLQEGVPILARLSGAESVDVVTRAGAGGMILTEAARPAQEVEMTEVEIKALVESAVKAAVAEVRAPVSLLEARALKGDAMIEALGLLESTGLPQASRQRVCESVSANLPIKDGAIEMEKFKTLVMAEARREGAYIAQLTGAGRVQGLGPVTIIEADQKSEKKRLKEARKEAERLAEDGAEIFKAFGLTEAAAKLAANGRVA